MSPKPKELDFGFEYDDRKIQYLKIPVEKVDIKELEWNLDIPFLEKEGTDDWNLTPRDLITNPEREPTHYSRVKNVDTRYAIAIYFHKDNWKILDGIHRYCKALMRGDKAIKVKKLTDKDIIFIKK